MRPRTYLNALINTFSSLKYYLEVLNSKFSFSLRFMLVSYLFLGIGFSLLFYLRELPRLEKAVEHSIQQLEAEYPQDLQIEWNGETLHSSHPTPIELPYPLYFPRTEESPSTFAYLDTEVKDAEQTFSRVSQSSLLFVTQNELLMSNVGIGWERFPLKEVPGFDHPFVVTKEKLPELLQNLRTMVTNSFSLIKVIFPSVLLPLFVLWRVLLVCIDSIIIYYLIRFFTHTPFPYLKVVQLSLHIMVVAETANLIVYWLLPHFSFPMFNLIFYVFLTLLLLHLRKIRAIQVRSAEEK